MGNTLKIALIVIGLGLVFYGLFLWFFPAEELISDQGKGIDQIIAMIGFGALMLLGGIAYKKR